MKLYNNLNGKLVPVKEERFNLERDIQKLFEDNLEEVTGLELVKTEFTIKGKRIDTLAFEPQAKAFIIIEYKRDRNSSVVDQGFSYLSLMLENKADFILTYNETLNKSLNSNTVDWSQTRVVFVSQSFTENQRLATNFKDLAIELWEIKKYDTGVIVFQEIKKTRSAESIKPLTQQNKEVKAVTEEIKIYTEEYHLERYPDNITELYNTYRDAIINLADDIEIVPKKRYIAFKKSKNFVDIITLKKGLRLYMNIKKGTLDDPKGLAKDATTSGHWGNGDYGLFVDGTENLEYIMSLIKQAIN